MKIDALRLFNVKRFTDKGVSIEGFGEGVNILSAPNEFGKTTSFEALNALFFVKHSSTANDAKVLRPYSLGSSLVEVDITLANGRYRISKSFFGRSFAKVLNLDTNQLIAQADEAENFIANLVHGGINGPTGLLWVKQGLTGLEKRSKSEEENEKAARTSLLQSVQGEVEAITGGRRMADILASTDEARSELVTKTGRPKVGGKYATAIELRDRLKDELSRLDQDVQKLRDALDRRAQNLKLLSDIDSQERQARLDAVKKAEVAFEAARAQQETLKTFEAQLNLACELKNSAQKDYEQYRNALGQISELSDRVQTASRHLQEAITRRTAAADAYKQALTETASAEQAIENTRALLDRSNAAQRTKDAMAQSQTHRDSLAKAIETRGLIEELTARLASTRVSAKVLKELEETEVHIARLMAMREAARPSLTVKYLSVETPKIVLDGHEIQGDADHTYNGHATLLVPGIGTISLRSNTSDDVAKLKSYEDRRLELLATSGLSNLDDGRSRQAASQLLENQLSVEKAKLAVLAPDGIDKLQHIVAGYADIDPALLALDIDSEQLLMRYEGEQEHRKAVAETLKGCEVARASTDAAYVTAQTDLVKLQAQMAQQDTILGPEDLREQHLSKLLGQLSKSDAELGEVHSKVATLRSTAIDYDIAVATLARVRSARDSADDKVRQLREDNAGLNAQIRTRSDEAVEEKRNEKAEALVAAEKRVANFEHEIAILDRLYLALDQAKSEARELYLTPVMTELQPLLSLLFKDASISFNDQTLLPETIQRIGDAEKVENLSGGMKEQLSILTRLAFARLMARDGRPVPVILDDALVYSDDDRIEAMFNALHLQARDQQIIVFSCRQRAFQKLGGNVLSVTDWHPQ